MESLTSNLGTIFMGASIIASGLGKAFPHATAACDGISAIFLNLGFLAINPQAAMAALGRAATTGVVGAAKPADEPKG